MKRLLIVCAAVVLALPCIIEAADLGTVDIAWDSLGAASVIKLWGGGRSGFRCYAGAYMLNKTAGTAQGNAWPNGLIGSFCIDLPQYSSEDTLTYKVEMPSQSPEPTDFLGGYMGAAKAGYIRELWGRYFDPAWVNGGPFSTQQKNDAEAFAAAIWEIIYEDLPATPSGWDVTVDGTVGQLGFRCEQADTAKANDWLHSLDGTGPKAELWAFTNYDKQDYIVEIPEPATTVMFAVGVLTLLRYRRWC